MSSGSNNGLARRRRLLAGLLPAFVLVMLAVPSLAQAHVNREVGPYTILVVLVEEPTFEDNHAGFEFWVRRGGQPIAGLEQSVRAEATGHGTILDLAVPPLDGVGFYVLDRTSDGVAFDPLGGGAWSLHLAGSIDGTPLDETFAVTFPSYPRVGTPRALTAQPAPGTAGDGSTPLLLLVAGALAAAAAVVALRLRPGRGQPTPAR
jgi:hypothetical protein